MDVRVEQYLQKRKMSPFATCCLIVLLVLYGMKNIISSLIILIVLLTGCTKPKIPLEHRLPSSCIIYDMKQAQCIDDRELVKRLAPYCVVFVGDHHSQTDLHQKLAKLITALDKAGRHVSLANEWFTSEDNSLLEGPGLRVQTINLVRCSICSDGFPRVPSKKI